MRTLTKYPTPNDQAAAWATVHLPLGTDVDRFAGDYADYVDELRQPMNPDPIVLTPAEFADQAGLDTTIPLPERAIALWGVKLDPPAPKL